MNKNFRKFCLFVLVILVASCSVVREHVHKSKILKSNPEPEVFATHIEDSTEKTFCQHTKTALNCVKIVEVHDGDTLFIDLPEAPPPFAERMPVRLAGIDAPELNSKNVCEKNKAQQAKQLTEALIGAAERIDIVNVKRDKHFRIDGEVLVDGKSVGEKLLKAKLAYPYSGGGQKASIDWCNY